MMNKRSYRFIAWLLTLVMILNISPLSAFADDANKQVSNREPSPGIEKESGYPVVQLSTGTPPVGNKNSMFSML